MTGTLHTSWTRDSRVWRTSDAGQTFEDVTGNLFASPNQGGPGASILQSIELFPNTRAPGDEVVFVGGLGGVYGTDDPLSGEATWVEFGIGLPNVQVKDVRFDATDNLLYIATLGRGAWSIPDLSDAIGAAAPALDLNGARPGRNNQVEYSQEGSAVSIAATDLTLIDPNSDTVQRATVTLKSLREREVAVLSADTSGTSIASRYDVVGEDGVLTLSGSDTLANYQQVIQSVTFSIESGNAATVPREVVVVVNDGVSNSAPSTSTISIQSLDGAPILDLNGPDPGTSFDGAFRRDAGAVPIVDSSRLAISTSTDVLRSAEITITNQTKWRRRAVGCGRCWNLNFEESE